MIITIKLSSGEELIGKYIYNDVSALTLEEIKVVVPATEADGSLSIRTFPWILTSMKEQHSIPLEFIVAQCPTDDKIAAQYIKETTGLIVFK